MTNSLIKSAICAASLALVPSLFADSWLFNGSNRISKENWTIRVSVVDAAARELKIPSWETPVVEGSGDLDLTGPIQDASGADWTIVSIGGGCFSNSHMNDESPTVTSLILPQTLETIENWAFDFNKQLTNIVFNCPCLTNIGQNSLRFNQKGSPLLHIVLNLPALSKMEKDAFSVPDDCVLDYDTFCLDSVTDLHCQLPRKMTRKGVLRLPKLQELSSGVFSGNRDVTGIILGSAREDGGCLGTIASGHNSMIANAESLEFLSLGAGGSLMLSQWTTFALAGCARLKRIFLQTAPDTACGEHFSHEPNGTLSICFYIRPEDASWSDVISGARALTDEEKAIFRERFGDDEPLPIGTVASSVFATSYRQFLSCGDYRSFMNEVVVRDATQSAAIAEMSPPRFAFGAPAAGEFSAVAIADVKKYSSDGGIRYRRGAVVETFDGVSWADAETNVACSVDLDGGTGSKRVTWIMLPEYRVSFSDRGFLEEYPESFTAVYPDGAPDENGYLPYGARVTLSVSGFATDGDHPGRFVAWEGAGADPLKEAGAQVTFVPDRPMNVHPRVEHKWTFTGKAASESGYDEVSDGNWRLIANLHGDGLLHFSGTTAYGYATTYLSGAGFLSFPEEAADVSSGRKYAFSEKIYARVFSNVQALRGIRLGPGYKILSLEAFKDCSNVTALELAPHALTTVSDQAFRNLTSLCEGCVDQTNLTGSVKNFFSGCSKMTNLYVNLPKVVDISFSFHNLPLMCDVTDWNLSSVTGLLTYAGLGSDYKRTVTGTLHLPSVKVIGQLALPNTIEEIDFDKAVPTSVRHDWAGWNGAALRSLRFNGKAPGRTVLDNLMVYAKAVDGDKRFVIRCSNKQQGWKELASVDYTDNELAAAESLKSTLAEKERLLGVYVTQDGARKAWLIHRPSPYDADPLVILMR